MAYSSYSETLTGADFRGTSPDKDRTYTLSNLGAIYSTILVWVDGQSYQPGKNFSFNSSTNTITILSQLWDDMDIFISYSVNDSPAGSSYATTLQIVRFSGIGVEITLETVGTGDNSETSFDFDFGNIIDGSYDIFYGLSDSNDFTSLTETTHYVIDKDKGTIELTPAGVTALGTNVIYAAYTYSPNQSNTVLGTYLAPAEKEVIKLTGNYWGLNKTSIEYMDGYDSGYPQTDRPFGEQIEQYPEFELKYKGVQSITSVEFLARNGDTDTTLTSTQYRIITDDTDIMDGRVLINTTVPNGKANVKITYIHGYTEVPALVQELTALVAGKMALVNISGGSYKDISTYQLGRKSFSIGQIYINIDNSIQQMQKRIDSIVDDLGFRFEIA